MKKFLSLALSLTLCLGLAAPAFAAGGGIQVVNTGIKADSVVNYEGYGSLVIDGVGEYYSDDFVRAPQAALVDRNGSFIFPYKDAYCRYYVSNGVVSLTQSSPYGFDEIYDTDKYPLAYYNMNGSLAFDLGRSIDQVDSRPTQDPNSYGYFGGPIQDGYTVGIKSISNEWRTYIIDSKGNIIYALPDEYNEILQGGSHGFTTACSLGWCGEGLFAYFANTQDEDWMLFTEGKGYMDPTGKTVIDLSGRGYTDLFPFHEGLAAVVDQAGKIGFVDKSGTLVIPCSFDRARSFCDGVCAVQKDGKWGYIDQTGKVVIPFVHDGAYGSGAGLASVVKDSKCGLVDYNNNVVVPFEYDDISSYEGGIAYAIKGGEVYLISGYQQGAQANPTNDKLTANGELQNPTVYKIGDSDYFKIRDLAAILNGTEKQFSVGYDNEKKSVTATTGQGYTKLDGDLAGAPAGQETAEASSDAIYVNGQKVEAEVYKIGGNNYFKLRDLGKALNFYVGYDSQTGIFIDTSKPYSE